MPRRASSPRRGRARSHARSGLRRKRIAALTGALAVVAAAVVALVLSAGSSARTAVAPPLPAGRCPLTDLPAPGGKVPDRPALAVKVGNEPDGARPQSGLDSADIVYDTPAEGFIMRYIAVFQCESAQSVGPTRSVRWVDWHVLQQYGHPILAFAGGIGPDVDTASTLGWLDAADLLAGAHGAGVRITSRTPPDNLYTSTSALWAMFPSRTPPPPVFSYSTAPPPDAKRASSLAIDFSPGTDIVWRWQSGSWHHYYASSPDTDAATSQPVTASNVVVEIVKYTFGPYEESPGGSGDVECQTIGTGRGYVLRCGVEVSVTWHHQVSGPTTFTDAAGAAVDLAPGRTWVELVPDTVAATIAITG